MNQDILTAEGRLKLHDIRNHLQVVAGLRGVKHDRRRRVERLFERAVRLVEEGAETGAVKEALEAGRTLLNEFLARDASLERIYDRIVEIVLSSESEPSLHVISVGELVRQEVSYYHNDLRRLPADRVVFSQAQDAYVRADRALLRRMVGNLLTNAAEALEDQGGVEVVVDLHGLGEPRHGLLGEIAPGAYATITVRDDGEGLPNEEVTHLLRPGYSTKGEARGLGMTVVRRAVEHSGGNLELQPVEPRGTLVRVYLPAVEPPAETEALAAGPSASEGSV